jgi:hypothetical protein
MDPKIKTSLYKCYTRPVLFYGSENIIYRKNEIKKLQTMEATLVKRSLGLSSRTRTTKLLYAMEIEPTDIRERYLKLKFIKRLFNNEYTKLVINEIIDLWLNAGLLYKDSLIKHIINVLNITMLNEDTILNDIEKELNRIQELLINEQQNEEVTKIKLKLIVNYNIMELKEMVKAF